MGQTYRNDPSPHQKFRRMETLSGITPVFTEIHDNQYQFSILISLTPDIFDTTIWFRVHDLLCLTRYNTHET